MRFTFRFLTEQYATEADLKKAYRKLAKKVHTDNGGKLEDIQQLNAEYDRLMKRFEADRKRAAEEEARKKAAEERAKKKAEQEARKKAAKEAVKNWLEEMMAEIRKIAQKMEAEGYTVRYKQRDGVVFNFNGKRILEVYATKKGYDLYPMAGHAECFKSFKLNEGAQWISKPEWKRTPEFIKGLDLDTLNTLLNSVVF